MSEDFKDLDAEEIPMFSGDKYPHNVLEGYSYGCLLDLRVRMAGDFLKSPLFANVVTDALAAIRGGDEGEGYLPEVATQMAAFSLVLAGSLLEIGKAEGLVEPLPSGGDLDTSLRAQAERTARFQVLQQIAGQKVAADEQNRVVAADTILGRSRPGH